jgi:Fe-S-cluster-containing hydrogenase component 2
VTNLHPLQSLRAGHWFKLICGASFQHLPAIQSLTLAYALAGADCVDVAADPAVISAAREALQTVGDFAEEARSLGYTPCTPWLMVSLNDGEDPHFRKAEFDPALCPPNCSRPCESICPAQAIAFSSNGFSGVINDRCYGCGRCLPICPIEQITTRSHRLTSAEIAPLVLDGVDAVEIHTQVGRLDGFGKLWAAIAPHVHTLKLIAISCPDGEGLIDYLRSLYALISPLPCALIWQTDGRPMSGDIGDGATRAAVKLGQKVLAAELPGYVQLAGGTNRHTVEKLRRMGLLKESGMGRAIGSAAAARVAGIAFGSYARALLLPVIDRLEERALRDTRKGSRHPPSHASPRLEEFPELLWEAVQLAHTLISPLKTMPIQLVMPPLPPVGIAP